MICTPRVDLTAGRSPISDTLKRGALSAAPLSTLINLFDLEGFKIPVAISTSNMRRGIGDKLFAAVCDLGLEGIVEQEDCVGL